MNRAIKISLYVVGAIVLGACLAFVIIIYMGLQT